jgi:multiple sugar transport system substrate-binding protein
VFRLSIAFFDAGGAAWRSKRTTNSRENFFMQGLEEPMGDKPLSRRDFMKRALIVGGAVAAVSCAPQAVQPAANEGVGEKAPANDIIILTAAHAWEAAFEAHQNNFDNMFNEKNPNIVLKRINSGWSEHNQIVPTWAAANELPDLVYVHGSRAYPWNKEGIMISIQNYTEVDTAFDVKGVWEEALKLYRYNGKQYEIPYDHGPVILGYNKDLFDAAGVAYPTEDWTMDDFLSAARALTIPEKQWGYSGYYGGTFGLGNELGIALVGPWGGKVFSDDESKLLIDSEEAITAMNWWVDLIMKEKVAPNPAESQAFPAGIWISGVAAMFGLATWGIPQMAEYGDFNYDVAPWPKGPGGRRTGSFGSGYGITKDSKNPDAAWKYMSDYLSTEGMEFMWAKSGRGSPARKSAYDAYLKAEINPPNVKYYMEALDQYAETGHPYQTTASGEVMDTIGRYTGLVSAGEMSVEECVKNIIAECNPLLEKAAS